MNQSQKYPKLMIVSNGKRTAALLDGAFLGKQIPKMEFVADGNDVRLRLVDIDVDSFRMEHGVDAFEEAVREFAEPEASPLDGIKQAAAEAMASYGPGRRETHRASSGRQRAGAGYSETP